MDLTSSFLGVHTMASETWNLSKNISLTLIFSILIQTIILVVFLTNLASTVANNSANIDALKNEADVLSQRVQSQEVTLGRIDENIKSIKEFLENDN
jgi:amino acid transporter